MARPWGPVQGASGDEETIVLEAVSIRTITAREGMVTKTVLSLSTTASAGRPGRGMVAVTWLVAGSISVALWPRVLKARIVLLAGANTMASGSVPVGIEETSLRLERSKIRTKPAEPSVRSVT